MATYSIKWLKNLLGTKFFPITHVKAVRDDNNTNLETLLSGKQQTLVSGTNIKTINGESVLGSGNISVSGGGGGGDVNVIESISVNNTPQAVDANKNVNITVPSKVSDLSNDSGFITGYTETDPVFSASAAAGISDTDIDNWNSKTSNIGTITGITMNGSSKGTSGVVNLGTVITAHQDISGKADKSATVSSVDYNTTSKKITKTINGTTTDVVTAAKIVTDGGGITTETDPTVPSWAKESSKPSYTASEVGAVPTTRTVNGKALSADITLSASDVSALPSSTAIPSKTSDLTNDSGFLTSSDISGVYKYKGSKTNYSNLPTSGNVTGDVWNVVNAYGDYPAGTNFAWTGSAWDALGGAVDLSGYVPTSRTVNGKALSSNISLSASDVSALPSSTYIPTKTSDLTNDSDFITSADIPEGAAASSTTPLMDGTAAVGTETRFARGDHRHPSDTSKQDVISDLATIRSNASAGAAKVSNVQADWNASTGLAVILNKPTIPAEVTESTVAGWGFTKNTGTYSKPSTGIPKTDLANAVQTSLGKADTALQSYTETDPVFAASAAHGITSSDITNWNSKTSNIGTITGINMNGASKGTSGVVDLGTVITSHQDISGKADKATTLAGYGIADAYTKSEVDDAMDDYLPLTGGTISTNSTSPLTIADIRSASELYVALLFKKGSTQLGYLGFLSQDTPVFVNHNGGTTQTLLHTGNFVAGTDYQTPIPANTYAPYNSNGYLPKNGGTMTGSITMGTNAIIFDKEVNTDWNVGTTNSGIRLFNSQSSIPTGAFSTYSTALSVYGAYGFQIASKSNANNFAMRSAYGTNYASWVTLYHSGNSNKSDVNWSCNNLTAAGTVTQGSDARVKDAQKEISTDDAIAVMEKLRPKTWTWNDKMYGNSGKKSAGLIAQEVKDIVPDAVTVSEMCDIEDFHSLNYTVIQGYEIAAIKGLIQENAQLKREIAEIKEMINKLNK